MCLGVLPMSIPVYHMCLVPLEEGVEFGRIRAWKGVSDPWEWNGKQLCATLWGLRIKPLFPEKIASF